MNKLDLNLKEVHNELVEFLRENFKKAGFSKAVLGLSGGIDSALVAYLLRDALGKENVLAIMMPYKSSNPDSLNHAKLVVEDLKINSKTIEITDMIDAYFKNEKEATSLRMGNKMARERMSILFDYSSKENALVVGTSNKTEIYLGYSTQFGDSACALNPIGDLYKTNIWDLSRYLKIPNELIEKKPSADLWEGQTDEQEMGLTYKEADQVLYRMLEENKTVEEVLAEGFNKDLVDNNSNFNLDSEYQSNLKDVLKMKLDEYGYELEDIDFNGTDIESLKIKEKNNEGDSELEENSKDKDSSSKDSEVFKNNTTNKSENKDKLKNDLIKILEVSIDKIEID